MPRMRLLTDEGMVFADVDDATDASTISGFWHAIKRFRDTGDARFAEFEGVEIAGHRFLTDLDAIEEFLVAGEADFESIYETP